MSEIKARKERSKNFSTEEECFLLSMAEKEANVIENKKTDAVTWEQKSKIWDKVDKEFDIKFGVKRGAKTLRVKYENLKRKARKCLAEEKRELYLTGGGQSKPNNDPSVDRLAALMGFSATGFSNTMDSDRALPNLDEVETIIEAQNGAKEEVVIDAECNTPNRDITNWSSWNPAQLKSKKNAKLSTPQCDDTAKTSLLQIQKMFFEEENRRSEERHKWEKEQADLKIQILQYELKIKKMELEKLAYEETMFE